MCLSVAQRPLHRLQRLEMQYDIVYYRSKNSGFKVIETVRVTEDLLADYIKALQNMNNTIFAIFSKTE
jgi:hypothetical protein